MCNWSRQAPGSDSDFLSCSASGMFKRHRHTDLRPFRGENMNTWTSIRMLCSFVIERVREITMKYRDARPEIRRLASAGAVLSIPSHGDAGRYLFRKLDKLKHMARW